MKSRPEGRLGVITVGTNIIPFPANEKQSRVQWRRLVTATRDERTWQLLYAYREKLKPYIGEVVRL